MIKFIYVILMNLFRAPYMIPKMRREADHPEKYSVEERYALARHVIRLMKVTGGIHTKSYGTELLPTEGGYMMYPNHQGKRLDKKDVRQALTIINEVSEEVKQGKRYILFPEGGYEFNNKNHVCDFKAGSFKIALKTKAPIVPVALIDSYKVFNSFCLGPVTTQVHYLKPILYDEYGGLKTHEIADLVKVRIQEKLDEVLKPAEAPVG